MNQRQLFSIVLLSIGVSTAFTCKICPRSHGFCLRRRTCGSGDLSLQHSELYSDIVKNLEHMLSGERCAHHSDCTFFHNIRNIHIIEYNNIFFKYFQYDEDQCAILLASAVTCKDDCCKSTDSAITSFSSINPQSCEICSARHHHSFCGNQNHNCGVGIISLPQSGVYHNLMDVTEHRGCHPHFECIQYSQLRNVHIVEQNGRIYKYMQHGITCSIFDTEDIYCHHGCCAAMSNFVDSTTSRTSSIGPPIQTTLPTTTTIPRTNSKTCYICPKSQHHPMCIRGVDCLSGLDNIQNVKHELLYLQNRNLCHNYSHCKTIDDHRTIIEDDFHFLYFRRHKTCYGVFADDIVQNCSETTHGIVNPQNMKSTTETKENITPFTTTTTRPSTTIIKSTTPPTTATATAKQTTPTSQTPSPKTTTTSRTIITKFIQDLVTSGEKTIAQSFNSTYRYIDDVLSLNNPKFGDYVNAIYFSELEIKDTNASSSSASYSDLNLNYGAHERLHLKLYDKRDDFNFSIVNFPFFCSNIPASPAYGKTCDKLDTITALAHSEIVTSHPDLVCSDGRHSLSDAAVIKLCNTTDSRRWIKGAQVIPNCSNINQYTAIASITDSGYSKDGVSGIMISCNSTHIKFGTQDCNGGFRVINVNVFDKNAYTSNALNYYIISYLVCESDSDCQ